MGISLKNALEFETSFIKSIEKALKKVEELPFSKGGTVENLSFKYKSIAGNGVSDIKDYLKKINNFEHELLATLPTERYIYVNINERKFWGGTKSSFVFLAGSVFPLADTIGKDSIEIPAGPEDLYRLLSKFPSEDKKICAVVYSLSKWSEEAIQAAKNEPLRSITLLEDGDLLSFRPAFAGDDQGKILLKKLCLETTGEIKEKITKYFSKCQDLQRNEGVIDLPKLAKKNGISLDILMETAKIYVKKNKGILLEEIDDIPVLMNVGE